MKLETLHDCFLLKTMALYDVELEILKAMPKMIKKATNPKLVECLTDHLAETEQHVERLENVFQILDVKPKKTKVEAIRGLVKDAEWCLKQDTVPTTLDMLIISSVRYVEHYEIAGYTALLEWSRILGLGEAESVIDETLGEEKGADSTLSDLDDEVASEAHDGAVDKDVKVGDAEIDEMDDDVEIPEVEEE